MRFWGVNAHVAYRIIAELLDLTCEAALDSLQTDELIPFNRCVRQGGSESPWLFNLVLRMILFKC
eukprot:1440646-Karenia_brevis.AAC.1